jgi:UDP-N-acetyl-D-mannosaminuronate dehydrogenase
LTVVDLPIAARTSEVRTADVTVIGGAGHVGIPLALSFAAKGLHVNVNDLNLGNLACCARRFIRAPPSGSMTISSARAAD